MIKNETVLMYLRTTRKAFLLEYGCAAVMFLMLVLNQFYGLIQRIEFDFILIGVAGLSLITAESSRFLHRCQITESKVLLIDGWLKQSKKHIFTSCITDVNSKQGYWQRLLNYGNVHIQSASGEESIELKNVNDPEKVVELLEDLIQESLTKGKL